MASDPLAALVLVGLGVRSLSVAPAALGPLREAMGRVRLDQVSAAASVALQAEGGPEAEHAADRLLGDAVADLREC